MKTIKQKKILAITAATAISAVAANVSFGAPALEVVMNGIEARVSQSTPPVEQKLRDVERDLTEAVSLLSQINDAPNWTAIPFKDSKSSLREKINQQMLQVIDILSAGRLQEYKKIAAELQEEIREAQKKEADATWAAANAGDGKRGYLGTSIGSKKSEADYLKEAAEARAQIAVKRQAIQEIATKLTAEFNKQGVEVTRPQVEGLLYSINGDDDVRIFASIETVKAITVHLGKKIQGVGENIVLAKRYFGTYAVLVRTIYAVQADYIRKIDEDYLPRLKSIRKANADSIKVNQKRIGSADTSEDSQKEYESDIKAAQLTEKVAALYEQHLLANKKKLQDALKISLDQCNVAESKYIQVKIAASLLGLMDTANKNFDQVMKLSAPPLLKFENQEMADAFSRLTKEMSGK